MLANLVYETANAPGTSSNVSLEGAVSGWEGFAQGFSSGVPVFYIMDDDTLREWGIGLFTAGSPDVLTRTTVKGNSAGTTARLNFSGAVRVYNTLIAEHAAYFDASGVLRRAGAVVGWQVVASYAPSGVSVQAIALPTTWRRFRLTLQEITVDTGADFIGLQFSDDGGSSWLTSSNYNYLDILAKTDGSLAPSLLTSSTSIQVSPALPASSADPWDAELKMFPGSAGGYARVHGSGYGKDSGNLRVTGVVGGDWHGSLGRMTACRVGASSGNFSGTIILEGLAA